MHRRKHQPPVIGTTSPRPEIQQALWLHGRHPVLAAVRNPCRRLDRLVATGESAAVLEKVALAAPVSRPRVETVDRRDLSALLAGDAVHQGFAALARPLPACKLETLLASVAGTDQAVVVVLDQVTDPRNIGAVLRSAEAFEATSVLIQDRHAPGETPALAKAASGALESVPLIRVTNIARALRTLREADFRCIGLARDAPLPLSAASLEGRSALVLGAEGSGLRRLVREACDVLARIPMAPSVDSLNLSSAAAIALYECACTRSSHAAAAASSGAERA
jgi:23S rRNA (guanosine2251-2'-O)-methyltransferase